MHLSIIAAVCWLATTSLCMTLKEEEKRLLEELDLLDDGNPNQSPTVNLQSNDDPPPPPPKDTESDLEAKQEQNNQAPEDLTEPALASEPQALDNLRPLPPPPPSPVDLGKESDPETKQEQNNQTPEDLTEPALANEPKAPDNLRRRPPPPPPPVDPGKVQNVVKPIKSIKPKPILKPLPWYKPKPPHDPHHHCCEMGKTIVNLHYKLAGVTNDLFDSVEVLQQPTAWNSKAICSHTALLKVRFDKITPRYCPGLCMNYPACRRRMLKVKLELHPSPFQRSGGARRMVNIGDSRTNNGWGGDANTQDNDAELDGKNNFLRMYPNDRCRRRLPWIFYNALAPSVMTVNIYLSNNFVRVTNNQYCDDEFCSECGFALNGQPDASPGGRNQEVFIALNRVVSGIPSRHGYGICRATFKWMCPWPGKCPTRPCDLKDPIVKP